MNTIGYYTEKQTSIEAIFKLAEALGYQTYVFRTELKDGNFSVINNIYFEFDGKQDWWTWYSESIDDLWFDEEADRQRVKNLNPATVLLFDYHTKSVAKIVEFMSHVMKIYGGWLDCEGSGSQLYTIETLSDIVQGCAFDG